MTDVDPAIRIEGLRVRYGDVVALERLDLTLPRGCVGLLGRNGAGKSTALKSILGFVRPEAGSIAIYGVRPGRDTRRRIGYMPERDAWFPGLSGYRAVTLAGELSGLARRDAMTRAHEVLHYAGIGEARYRPVESYSTGMRQRVKLAQALVHDPPLLFLDEPTNGLDPKGRAEMLGLIADLTANHGKDVILSTHILRDAEAVVDWVAIVERGQLVTAGDVDTLVTPSGGTFSAHITGDAPVINAALAAAGVRGTLDPDGTGSLTLPEDADPSLVFAIAHDAGSVVERLVPLRVGLEDAFFARIDAVERTS